VFYFAVICLRMASCVKCARYSLVVITFFFLLLGAAIIAAGIVGYVKSSDVESQATILKAFNIPVLSLVIAACGVLIVGTSFCGFCGAVRKELRRCVQVYSVVLILICLTQIAIGIYLSTVSVTSLQSKWEENSVSGQNARIAFQDALNCCGFIKNDDSINLPPTGTPCPRSNPPSCSDAANTYIKDQVIPISIAAIVIGGIEIAAIILSFVILYREDLEAKKGGINSSAPRSTQFTGV